jgi:hypothetical protein
MAKRNRLSLNDDLIFVKSLAEKARAENSGPASALLAQFVLTLVGSLEQLSEEGVLRDSYFSSGY